MTEWNFEKPVASFSPDEADEEMRRLAFALDRLKATNMYAYREMSRQVEIRMHQLRKRTA